MLPEDLERALRYRDTLERLLRRGATVEVDSRAPLGEVVEGILRHIER
jgi:hypothetical protein